MIQPGLTHSKKITVDESMLASTIGSGELPVFATPKMILLTEMTASECVKPYLEEGQTTVGTKVNIDHSDSTPTGVDVTCAVELKEVDRRRLVFSAEIRDEYGIIGSGIHERFIVDGARFTEKANRKLKN